MRIMSTTSSIDDGDGEIFDFFVFLSITARMKIEYLIFESCENLIFSIFFFNYILPHILKQGTTDKQEQGTTAHHAVANSLIRRFLTN